MIFVLIMNVVSYCKIFITNRNMECFHEGHGAWTYKRNKTTNMIFLLIMNVVSHCKVFITNQNIECFHEGHGAWTNFTLTMKSH